MAAYDINTHQVCLRRPVALACLHGLAWVLTCLLAASCVSRSPQRSGTVLHPQSADEFRQILRGGSRPVLAVFTSASCSSCRSLAESLDGLAADYRGRLTVVQADLAVTGALIQEYNLIKVPTTIVLRNGQEVDRWHGALPPILMKPFIEKALRVGRQ